MAAHPPGETISFREPAPLLPAKLARVVAERFPGEPRAASLAGAFLALNRYDRRFATELVSLGRERAGASWNLRLFAASMLAGQCLRLAAAGKELTFLFESLGLLAAGGRAVDADVLRQGYTSTELSKFSAEFLGHLRRLARTHRRLRGLRTTAEALDDFIIVSRDPCKVPLARYLFAPAEVVERVVQELQVSKGLPSPLEEPGEDEARRYRSQLPVYENEIVRLLTDDARIYWSCERTSSEINRLIEKPLGTVACALKPPGSALEFEIKRTGIGGPFPLGAVYLGVNGNPVPPSHRLQGGASTASLRWESNHCAILSDVYRAAHHREAPVSKLLSLASYRSVPCQGRDVHLLDYFTSPDIFGPGFQKMRHQMKQCVASYDQQYSDYDYAHLPGEAGLTGRFLYHVLPSQGLLAQTTSYRLDTLARYFSPAGPEAYFQHGLKRESHTIEEARRFADALLEEVLGVHVAPDATYVDHAQYLTAAFAVPENRRQADGMHAQAVSDLGQLWGTILALGGFSYGESFVGRNMGLKSSFAGGEWTSRLISMDHDNLHIPDDEEEVFWAQGALRTAVQDECYIRGNPGRPKQVPRSALHYLQQIYHLQSDDTPAESRRLLESAMDTAYRQTRRALENEPRMRRLFSESYLRHLRDWQVVVADYLTTVPEANAAAFNAWKDRTRAYLTERKYGEVVENYCKALEKHGDFVRRYSFFYLPPPPQLRERSPR